MADIQRFVNQVAGAIHRAAPGALVTNGAWSFRSHSDRLAGPGRPDMNYYADARLIAAGGDPDGTLDFYTVHYYEWGGTALSPFHHPVAYWGLGAKPVVIAEFFLGGGAGSGSDGNDNAVFGIAYTDLFETLYDGGYAGALGWQWFNYPTSAEGVVNWPRIRENAATMLALHPDAVDVLPSFGLLDFSARPAAIEAGQSSTLSWSTRRATATLDGASVEPSGTLVVSPSVTTTYTLVATDTDDPLVSATRSVTVSVVAPELINRALDAPATASTYETCCGPGRGPDAAADGDGATRWSSAWNTGAGGGTPDIYLDSDPNDEWLAVDLGAAYDVARVVLAWEAAHATSYDIETSYDGHLWTSVHAERAGDGGTDDIALAAPAPARFVRMHGLDRAVIGGQRYGFSLWEMEVYGVTAALQPPAVEITSPGLRAVVPPGATVPVAAAASDTDGTVARVDFYLDGALLSTDTSAPFAATWPSAAPGAHALTAIATDSDGLVVSTGAYPVLVAPASAFQRTEAEAGVLTGDAVATPDAGASGGSYVRLDGENGGAIRWTVSAVRAGRATVTLGYRLPFDEKTQYLVVNGDTTVVRFTGAANQWLQRSVEVDLVAGANEIRLERFWGYMHLDYLGVELPAVVDAAGPVAPGRLHLAPPQPNPFASSARLAYTLAEPGVVRLDVLDVTGRTVAVVAEGFRAEGAHEDVFDAAGLAGGVYLVRLQVGDAVQVRRVLLAR
jgi:hypothetical protein